MSSGLQDLFLMFYPLASAEKRRWAEILSQPDEAYLSALEEEAGKRGLAQKRIDGAAAWCDPGGRQMMLLFRIENPGDLNAVRAVYDLIAANDAPLAYVFVHQLPDGRGTWDVFQMSKLTYLAHCNRVSGPGWDAES